MRQRANGKETKKNILDAAKALFYENTFRNTTYDDICKAVGINAGTLYYHYNTKAAIANLIYEEFFRVNRGCLHLLFSEKVPAHVYAAVEIRSYLTLLFQDALFYRFFADIYRERIPNKMALKDTEEFYRKLHEEFSVQLEEPDLRSMVIAAVGYQCEFILNYSEGYFLKQTSEQLMEQYIRMRLQFARIPPHAVEEAIVRSEEILQGYEISVEPYFAPVYTKVGNN